MNMKRLISCALVLSMILGGFSILASDADASLDYIVDISSLQATYRGQAWDRDGDFMIAVGNDSLGNGVVHRYNATDGSWNSLATDGNARFNAVTNTEAFTWYDNMEIGVNGWTRYSWHTTDSFNGYTIITNVWELQNMTNDLTGKYVLANDIDASITVNWNGGTGFLPVGNFTDRFTGIFEGNNCTITGLYINTPAVDHIGLFGYIDAGVEVRNVGLVDVNITGHDRTGSLTGTNNMATIRNTYATGSVTGNYQVGGLVGVNLGTINDTYSTCYVVGHERVGGLVGNNKLASITNSYSAGSVTGSIDIGGLVGLTESATATDCYWDMDTSGQANSGGGTGKTTAQMMHKATFVNWDFMNIWGIDENVSYPYLPRLEEPYAQWVQGNPINLPDPDSGTSHGVAHSGSNAWWFGRPSTGDYDGGARIAGSLISPAVALPGISSTAAIVFDHWFEVESGGNYDCMTVSIKNTTDSGWYVLKQWDGSDRSFTRWRQEVLMIPGWQGNTIQLNFTFDTMDAFDNGFAGWHIDDVLLYTNDVYIVVGEPGAGGYSAYVTDGYSSWDNMGVNLFDFNDVAAGGIGHSFLAVGDGGNVQYYDGTNWNTIWGAASDDVLTSVSFNGTHWFIVGYNSTGSGKAYYYTQSEFHNSGKVILHPILYTPECELNDVAWSNRHPSHRQRTGLGAVAAEGTVTSFGDPEIWSMEHPVTGSPPARLGADLTYVISSGATLMFGGTNTAYSNETWLHSSPTNQWYNFTTAIAPPARYGCEVVFDPDINATILFGGYNNSVYMNDTWIFWVDNSTWLELSPPSSPPGRYRHEMVYDEVNNRIIMYGGQASGGVVGDSWEFSGGTWTEITPGTPPPARMSHAMTYSPEYQQIFMFGGEAADYRNDTWSFNVTTDQWTNITPVRSPSVRSRHEMVYDRYNGFAIMFGGRNGGNFLGDTWVYVPGENLWHNVYPHIHPSIRSDYGFVYDYSDGEPKLYGGMNGAAISDTWQCSMMNPWGNNADEPALGTNGENFTAVAWDLTGKNALFVGYNASHGVVYNYDFNNDYVAIIPGTGSMFPGHKFYDIAYRPHSRVQEAVIAGQSAFRILPNMVDTSTRITANVDKPHIFDVDFRDQTNGLSRLNRQVDVDHVYTFYVDMNYTIGGVDHWSDTSIGVVAWYDEGQVGIVSSPESNWNTSENRTRQFNITYDVSAGSTTLAYPTGPAMEFTLDSTWEDPAVYPGNRHRMYINVSFQSQTRMADGQGFAGGAAPSGRIWDQNSALNDPNTWDFSVRVYDDSNVDVYNESFEEFGIVESVSVSVTGNPSGNAPPGSANVSLSDPSLITYSSNTNYWVNVSIPDLLVNGVGPAFVSATDVTVINSNNLVSDAYTELNPSGWPTGRAFQAPNAVFCVWGNRSQVTQYMPVPMNGTTSFGPWGSDYNLYGNPGGTTRLDWWVTVPAGTSEGIYWAIITVTIDIEL